MDITSGSYRDCAWQPSFIPSACFDLFFLTNAAMAFVFLMGVLAGICLMHIRSDRKSRQSRVQSESGNIFFALFAAMGMVGVIGAGMMTVMKGPTTTISQVTKRSVAENNMIASTRLAVVASAQQASDGDCDADGFIEPIPFRNAGSAAKPTGGGYLPTTLGASLTDPWGVEYGYCVWDHGSKVKVAGCGGASANRLAGAPNEAQYAVAVISAGPDKAFQTSCNAYVDANADGKPDVLLLNKPGGSDDVILGYTYAEARGLGEGLWNVKEGSPGTAEITKNLEVKSSGGNVVFGVDSSSDPSKPSIKVDFINKLSASVKGVEFLSNILLGNNWLSGDGDAEGIRIDAAGNVGIGTAPTHKLTVGNGAGSNMLRIDQGTAYDVWIQGGSATSGEARNLALLGVKADDTLRVNHSSEYAGGTMIGGPVFLGTLGQSLNLGSYGVTGSAGAVLDANGGWVRTYNNTGWYNVTHGGGWYMNDADYIRNYNGKSLYVSSSGTTASITGATTNATGRGVYGIATATTGINHAVFGSTSSTEGRGVSGYATATTGENFGVRGVSDSVDGQGVGGYASASSGTTTGVYGSSLSANGHGVQGRNGATTGNAIGVYGWTDSATGYGVYSRGNAYVLGNLTVSGNTTSLAYFQSSDKNLKADIENISDPFAILNGISGKHYTWKKTGKAAYGVIAQDVETVMPEAVSMNDSGYKTVEYVQIIAPLVEAVKQLKADNDNLRAEILRLKEGNR